MAQQDNAAINNKLADAKDDALKAKDKVVSAAQDKAAQVQDKATKAKNNAIETKDKMVSDAMDNAEYYQNKALDSKNEAVDAAKDKMDQVKDNAANAANKVASNVEDKAKQVQDKVKATQDTAEPPRDNGNNLLQSSSTSDNNEASKATKDKIDEVKDDIANNVASNMENAAQQVQDMAKEIRDNNGNDSGNSGNSGNNGNGNNNGNGDKSGSVSGALGAIGAKMKAFGQKAVNSATKFVDETDNELKSIKTMEGLVTMASNEFENYIKQRSNTTDKVKFLKQLGDNFKDSCGIVFVASFNVSFAVGGSYGRGIVMKRFDTGNWSLPLAIEEIEGNVGWQLNISRVKSFYVLKTEQAIKNFQQKQNVKLGGKGFAAIGNLGIQASGDVKASKESMTVKDESGSKNRGSTNAGVGNVKGFAIGVALNAGTFQSCKKINEQTYNNFDITKLFDNTIENVQNTDDNINNSNKVNSVNDVEFITQLNKFIRLMEGVIAIESKQNGDSNGSNNNNKDVSDEKNDGVDATNTSTR